MKFLLLLLLESFLPFCISLAGSKLCSINWFIILVDTAEVLHCVCYVNVSKRDTDCWSLTNFLIPSKEFYVVKNAANLITFDFNFLAVLESVLCYMLELQLWGTQCLEKQQNRSLLLTCLKIWLLQRLLCGQRYAHLIIRVSWQFVLAYWLVELHIFENVIDAPILEKEQQSELIPGIF